MEVNYTGAVTAVTSQIGDALTAGLPVLGVVLGIVIGIAFFKRLVKGK